MSNYYKNRKEIEIKVGLFFIVAVVLLFLGIAFLKNVIHSGDRESVKIKFSSTNGLDPGDKIKINGIAVGKIVKLNLLQDGVLVEGIIEKQEFLLKEGTLFIASESSLMGGHHLDIIPGSGEGEVDFTKMQVGSSGTSIFNIIGQAETLIADLGVTVAYIKENLDIIDSTKDVITNVDSAVSEVRNVIDENRTSIATLLEELNRASSNINSLVDNNRANIDSTFNMLPEVIVSVQERITDLEVVMNNVNNLFDSYNNSDNSVKKLVEEREIYDDLRKTISSVDSLINDVKKNPKKYLKIEIF
ncbi:MAG: hypothetical protein B6226_04550 [Candidatus Cloacimonetes bacterium 4572_65]|nr:MAG: hypothetical protein B6226_04550 [Candidatus Cloacimonetes bacterium 4572_65]